MSTRPTHSKILYLFSSVLVAILAFAAGSALVAKASNPVTFYACQNVKKNTLYNIVTSPGSPLPCLAGDIPVEWNQVGPMGPQGPKGDTGPMGPQGPQGEPGPAGSGAVLGFYTLTFQELLIPPVYPGTFAPMCNSGDVAVGGGITYNPANLPIVYDAPHPVFPAGWYVVVQNNTYNEQLVDLVIRCADMTP